MPRRVRDSYELPFVNADVPRQYGPLFHRISRYWEMEVQWHQKGMEWLGFEREEKLENLTHPHITESPNRHDSTFKDMDITQLVLIYRGPENTTSPFLALCNSGVN